MSPNRGDRDNGRPRSRHTHHSKRESDDTSDDSGYGGSATASPKLYREEARRGYHPESTRHDAKFARQASPSQDRRGLDEKNGGYSEQKDPESDTDYDPRDRYYLDIDDDEYEEMSFRNSEALKNGYASKDGWQQRESGISTSSGRTNRHHHRHKSSSSRRRDAVAATGGNPGDLRKRDSSEDADISSTQADSRRARSSASSRYPRSKASAASHSRHESNYRSLSPIPSDSGTDSDDASPTRPLRAPSRHGPRASQGEKSTKSHETSVGWIDPKGETPQSFLQKLTKGIDIKSVGRVGLDAAAVAAIKVAVGTRVPWQQRIPKTIAAGAAAAIMDFIVKKTSFQPKGMVGTMFARQFVEIILANLIVNPVSTKVSGAAKRVKGGGRIPMIGSGDGGSSGGGGKGRR